MESQWRIEMLGWLRAAPVETGSYGEARRVMARFRSRKAAALLAYLAYHPRHAHPRSALIDLLWPDSSFETGRTNLRTELSWLRLRLEVSREDAASERILLTEGDTVRLDPAAFVTDVTLFEGALHAAVRAQHPADRLAALTEAVNQYRGELLPGHLETWVVPERLRLSEAFLQAMHELVIGREQAGDRAGALQWAWRAVSVDALREETHADLIRLLLASGQRKAAQQVCHDRDQRLERDLLLPSDPEPVKIATSHEPVARRSLRLYAAEAEELRRRLTQRTAEVEQLQQQLLCATTETRALRQELALRAAETEELWRLLKRSEDR